MNDLSTIDCHPISIAPGQSRLFLDYCASLAPDCEATAQPSLLPFYPSLPRGASWSSAANAAPLAVHRPELVRLLTAQNPAPSAAPALAALSQGAGVIVTGQQVGLFGGPLYTPFKAATALGLARQATQSSRPHAAIFWLATEDHDFAEIDHIVFPARRELRKLVYSSVPQTACPVGAIVLGDAIAPLIDEAWELLGASAAMDALAEAYKPGRSFAQAFADFYSRIFAAQGLLVLDAASRDFHRLGAPVLRAAIERADEFHSALLDRNRQLEAAGYHAQVAVTPQSSLLFLIHEGARLALKRIAPTPAEPAGLWQAGRQTLSTNDLTGILDSEPERISPSALLRPVFQDLLLSTSVTIGGPAEIAYFAQSAVLFERILGRVTPALPRFSPPPSSSPPLATCSAATSSPSTASSPKPRTRWRNSSPPEPMPVEGKQKLAAAGKRPRCRAGRLARLDAIAGHRPRPICGNCRQQDALPDESSPPARRQLPNSRRKPPSPATPSPSARLSIPTERSRSASTGAAYYFARHGLSLAEDLTVQAAAAAGTPCHAALWL